MDKKKVLITGGAGYIGTHTCLELIASGYEIVVIDNFSNSKEEALKRVFDISGKKFDFYEGDVLDKEFLRDVFSKHNISSVIHFAGLKSVGESVEKPLMYYHNNVAGTIALCEVMSEFNVKKIVFSSSATVYGDPASVPILESFPLSTTNPYGRSKLIIEEILGDLYLSDNEWSIVILRYFNPIGAHSSTRIGEDPNGIPNNIMPYITQVAIGKRDELSVFGNDYNTHDGTGVRDYIHVVDLAHGHICALEKALSTSEINYYNLGTGKGYSVLDLVKAFEEVSGVEIPYKVISRRSGDIAECYADTEKAFIELGWKAQKNIVDMCRDSFNWQKNNPSGYL
ncbi:MAG: UDP-glucose 4-epimerase GalE [Acidaminobacteraceae bacterium]